MRTGGRPLVANDKIYATPAELTMAAILFIILAFVFGCMTPLMIAALALAAGREPGDQTVLMLILNPIIGFSILFLTFWISRKNILEMDPPPVVRSPVTMAAFAALDETERAVAELRGVIELLAVGRLSAQASAELARIVEGSIDRLAMARRDLRAALPSAGTDVGWLFIST